MIPAVSILCIAVLSWLVTAYSYALFAREHRLWRVHVTAASLTAIGTIAFFLLK